MTSTALSDDLTPVRVAYLGLGSNLGDRAANIETAIALLGESVGIEVVRRARVIATAPMYVTEQPEFLNTCIAVSTTLDPHELLRTCLAVETMMGRVRERENGPRNIDLDILLFDDLIVDAPHLTIPHPAMLERDFVLIPLAEIAPHVPHPHTGRAISEERDRANDDRPEQSVDDERDVAQ